MNVEVQGPPTRLLRREVRTAQIRFDLVGPDFYCGSIRPVVDVFVEILGGRNGATDLDVNEGVVLRAEPVVVRGDPLVGNQESFLRIRPADAGPPVLRESFYFYCIRSEAFGVSVGAFAAFHAGRLRIRRLARTAHHRCRYSTPVRMIRLPARYYIANNAIVIACGIRGVFICRDAAYVGIREASSLKINNLKETRCPSKDSDCVNIPHDEFYLYTEYAGCEIRPRARILLWKHGFSYRGPIGGACEGNE